MDIIEQDTRETMELFGTLLDLPLIVDSHRVTKWQKNNKREEK